MFLAPENKIIIMGFKGSGSVFDNIFDEFRNPLRTQNNLTTRYKRNCKQCLRSYLLQFKSRIK